jgi:hypothetical protein
MHSLWIVLTCFAGLLAFGFLLAGLLGFLDFERLNSPGNRIPGLVDALLLGGAGFMVSSVAKNWSHGKEARRMIYTGLVALVILLVFGYLAAHHRDTPED